MLNTEKASGSLDGIGQKDRTITSEYHIFGPPGTGKTSHLSGQIKRAVNRYGPNAVLVTSFSRTAAAELAECDLPIGEDRLGTLHSHCFRALGRPRIAEAFVGDWNRRNPHMALTGVRSLRNLEGEDTVEDSNETRRAGDSLLGELNRYRSRMIGWDLWSTRLREFEQKWSQYKRDSGLFDFCDLIERCLSDFAAAPGNPAVLFADEAQDLSPMQLRLMRQWGEHAEYFVLAGDDDQAIFTFTGATPDAILYPGVPDDHKIILRQSHRVPRAIYELTNKLIHQVTKRQEKTYLPRPANGSVHRLGVGTYKSPEYSILSSAVQHLERNRKVMFLASCSYMLKPVVAVLRKNSIPFHNPYRKGNGFWNPLRLGKKTASRRIEALLVGNPKYGAGQGRWICRDVQLWVEWMRDEGVLRIGAKDILRSSRPNHIMTPERLAAIFEGTALSSLMASLERDCRALLDWWRARLDPQYRQRIQFPADVVARYGPHSIAEEPRVVVGTIHSVKGGQADVVYLFPDLSQAGDGHYQRGGAARDSVIRVFYVGATRSREILYICQRDGAKAISL